MDYAVFTGVLHHVCVLNCRSEEERDLWTKKLQSVISDACNHRQTYFYEDFYEQNIPKFHPDPEIKSVCDLTCLVCMPMYPYHTIDACMCMNTHMHTAHTHNGTHTTHTHKQHTHIHKSLLCMKVFS